MRFNNKRIGIWGFGVVGKSAANYFLHHKAQLSVMEKRLFTRPEMDWFAQNRIQIYDQNSISAFFENNELILASPGIDTSIYPQCDNKLICELDIFAQEWKKPIIAITGTVGKTSNTHFLSLALAQTKRVATAGNIGTGMLDLINKNDQFDYAVLELSSFQLEHLTSKLENIQLVVWTNLYPNHLDRHGSIDSYLNAKLNLLTHSNQKVLLNTQLLSYEVINNFIKNFPERVSLYCSDEMVRKDIPKNIPLYYFENGTVIKNHQETKKTLFFSQDIPSISYQQNWLAVIAALDILHMDQVNLHALPLDSGVLSHRLNPIETHEGITFYDDSKGTVPEATLSAVAQFKDQPLILILGGISKGVDRSAFIKLLPQSIKHIICFGSESESLHKWCIERGFMATEVRNLEEVVIACKRIADSKTPVLFSPAGASYDLFTDYKDRGKKFKELIGLNFSAKEM